MLEKVGCQELNAMSSMTIEKYVYEIIYALEFGH